MDSSIREATGADAQRLAELSAELGYTTAAADVERRLNALVSEKGSRVLVIVEDQTVAGFVAFEKHQTVFLDPGVNITGLVVDGRLRGRGLGRRLVEAVESFARREGLSYIRANSGSQRSEAHQFYRDLGFDHGKDQKRFLKPLSS